VLDSSIQVNIEEVHLMYLKDNKYLQDKLKELSYLHLNSNIQVDRQDIQK
jgi:hypothetical protein